MIIGSQKEKYRISNYDYEDVFQISDFSDLITEEGLQCESEELLKFLEKQSAHTLNMTQPENYLGTLTHVPRKILDEELEVYSNNRLIRIGCVGYGKYDQNESDHQSNTTAAWNENRITTAGIYKNFLEQAKKILESNNLDETATRLK